MDKISRQLLKLATDPNATMDQLLGGIKLLEQSIDAENARRAAMPPQPVLTQEERLIEARRRANANLARLRRRQRRRANANLARLRRR